MTDAIRIQGIEVFAHHGVFESEKESGQTFVIDLELSIDLGLAGSSDNLEDTVDYGNLAGAVHDLVASTRHNLIEKVAVEVADMALALPGVDGATVTVHKPKAPIEVPFDDVSVTVSRIR